PEPGPFLEPRDAPLSRHPPCRCRHPPRAAHGGGLRPSRRAPRRLRLACAPADRARPSRDDPGGGRPRLLHPPARSPPARAAAWRAGPGQAPMSKPLPAVLAFDVFGTVVDWHGTISREVDALGLGISGSDFATEWRAGYAPAMDR